MNRVRVPPADDRKGQADRLNEQSIDRAELSETIVVLETVPHKHILAYKIRYPRAAAPIWASRDFGWLSFRSHLIFATRTLIV